MTEPHGAAALTGPGARDVLDAALAATGAQLHDWRVRSVHWRGSSSVAVVYEVTTTDRHGDTRDLLYVGHASTRRVPDGAARVDVDGGTVHVWQFPHDPYLPGLPDAVNRAVAGRLLRRLGLDAGLGDELQPSIRTRSYRPTRRAVVQLRAGDGLPVAAYLKLLGGRSPRAIAARAEQLAAVHAHVAAAVPSPPVIEVDTTRGAVVLAPLPGATLRSTLRDGGTLPDARAVRDLLVRLHALPPPPGDADPDGFADVTRHVERLRRHLPEQAANLSRLAEVAATVGGPTGTVHGDLHDGQLLVAGGSITGVLDVDGAGTGRVAHDIGRLLAHVEASAVTRPDTAPRVATYVAELTAALADLAPVEDVAAAAGAAWVGLATGPLRVASADWRREATARIQRGLAWAERTD